MKRESEIKLKSLLKLSASIIILGLLLLAYMIIVEDEPGAIPLLMIVLGLGSFAILRVRLSRLQNNN